MCGQTLLMVVNDIGMKNLVTEPVGKTSLI